MYETSRLGVSIQIFSHVLAYTNSFINPILYNCFSENFRKAFRKVSVFIGFFICQKTFFCLHSLIFLLFVYTSIIYFRQILLVLFSCHCHEHTLTMKSKKILCYTIMYRCFMSHYLHTFVAEMLAAFYSSNDCVINRVFCYIVVKNI